MSERIKHTRTLVFSDSPPHRSADSTSFTTCVRGWANVFHIYIFLVEWNLVQVLDGNPSRWESIIGIVPRARNGANTLATWELTWSWSKRIRKKSRKNPAHLDEKVWFCASVRRWCVEIICCWFFCRGEEVWRWGKCEKFWWFLRCVRCGRQEKIPKNEDLN